MAAQIESRIEEREPMSIVLRYSGPAVDDGSMDVYETAASMTAFSDYVVIAAKAAYGDSVDVKAEVRAFARGSFATDLLFHLTGMAGSLLSATPDVKGALSIIKESLNMFRFLNGKEPKGVEYVDDHSIKVTNNNGQITTTHIETLNVTLDPKAGVAAETFIAKVLARPGIESLAITSDTVLVARALKSDSEVFHRIQIDTVESMVNINLSLTVENANFSEGKWRFFDGETSFRADIEDQVFLAKVDNGEPFRKGDILECVVRLSQYKAGRVLRSERTIIQVLRHRSGFGDQINLFPA